jgi:hypothetical protein
LCTSPNSFVAKVNGKGDWRWHQDSTASDDTTEDTSAIAISGVTVGRYLRDIDAQFYLRHADATDETAAGVHKIPGVVIDANLVRFWHGDETDTDVDLDTDASTEVLEQTFAGLNASSNYLITFGFRVNMWQLSTPANCGSIDGQVDVHLATSAGSVATCTLKNTFYADTTRLPTALAGATATLAPSTGGITISATRPTGVACRCSCAWWVTEFKELVVT